MWNNQNASQPESQNQQVLNTAKYSIWDFIALVYGLAEEMYQTTGLGESVSTLSFR